MTTMTESNNNNNMLISQLQKLILNQNIQCATTTAKGNVHFDGNACTRILNQWKKEVLPRLSRKESLALLKDSLSIGGSDDGGDGGSGGGSAEGEVWKENHSTTAAIATATARAPAPIVQTLLALIQNEGEFTKEGHRETSVLILKGLLQCAFASDGSESVELGNLGSLGSDDDELAQKEQQLKQANESERPPQRSQNPQIESHQSLDRKQILIPEQLLLRREFFEIQLQIFDLCSVTLQKRFHRSGYNNDQHSSSKGTMMELAESSEHIRLLLVELVQDLVSYLKFSITTIAAMTTMSGVGEGVDGDGILKTGRRCCSSISSSSSGREHGPVSTEDIFHQSSNQLLSATSRICQTISKSALLDPFPEIQRASCTLLESLSIICPLAVRMNAATLLFPLTGQTCQCSGESTMPPSVMTWKQCLFRHRHSKVRCRAVDASVSIVLCCPRSMDHYDERDEKDELVETFHHSSSETHSPHATHSMDLKEIQKLLPSEPDAYDHGQNAEIYRNYRGSDGTSMGRYLHDFILPGWEEILKNDSSASVRCAVLKALGKVASFFGWNYSPRAAAAGRASDEDDSTWPTRNSLDSMNLVHLTEARLLAAILLGFSDGNVTQVRPCAIGQLLCAFHAKTLDETCDHHDSLVSAVSNSGTSQNATHNPNDHVPWEIIAKYFHPMLELTLTECSNHRATSQNKVRSIDTLQVLIALSLPLLDKKSSPMMGSPAMSLPKTPEIELDEKAMRSIICVLSKNVLSEEKDVLDALLSSCRILGNSNQCGLLALKLLAMDMFDESKGFVAVGDMFSSVEPLQPLSDPDETMTTTPRQMTSMLLILYGLMGGCVSNEEAAVILNEIDPLLAVSSSDWFVSSSSELSISTLLCHPSILNGVTSLSSMAWALLDACSSFVKCVRHFRLESNEDIIINIVVAVVFLLGCPEDYGVSSLATSILNELSSFYDETSSTASSAVSGEEISSSLLDVYFRQAIERILSLSPEFPWRQADPAFLAMDALLRASRGSTVGNNFDIVAPFFIHHLSTSKVKNSEGGPNGKLDLNSKIGEDAVAEEYSLRITLMSLLQTILSDDSFSKTIEYHCTTSTKASSCENSSLHANFSTDVLLSIVLPNLVWKPGGLASALRKLSAATLFSLVSHHHKHFLQQGEEKENQSKLHRGEQTGPLVPSSFSDKESLTRLVPILNSNLEDTESTTRELSCRCLSLILEVVPTNVFQSIWESDSRIIDSLYPRLLSLLDDSHDPVRIGGCRALANYLRLTHNAASSTCRLGISSMENICSALMIHLDDPDGVIQDHVFEVLLVMLKLQYQNEKKMEMDDGQLNQIMEEHKKKVVKMMERHVKSELNSHRNGSYIHLLLDEIVLYWKQDGVTYRKS